MTGTNNFATPDFKSRVSSMLKLDFYRLFHTPVFYIMLAIAAIIPAMVISLAGVEFETPTNPNAPAAAGMQTSSIPAIENAWSMIESGSVGSEDSANDSDVISGDQIAADLAGFANINMLYIFAALLMAIFVAHDYSSGFIKNIFTVHSKKIDYIISKTAIGLFGGTGMIVTYLIGTIAAGALTGKLGEVAVSGLIFCLISKALLMGIFCSLFLCIAVFFKNRFWLTIVFTFLFGMMLYPAATNIADLNAGFLDVIIALAAGVGGTMAIGAISTTFLNKRDLA